MERWRGTRLADPVGWALVLGWVLVVDRVGVVGWSDVGGAAAVCPQRGQRGVSVPTRKPHPSQMRRRPESMSACASNTATVAYASDSRVRRVGLGGWLRTDDPFDGR
ncbi:hypothetical protein [Nocardia sp. CC201C]|uniref:hypothetical protein n=1 Tax=Nocardia sp. CC201C TaxID=3044575 RepID=UPI0024A8EFC2|nr:hypothetical protein [Nocardia sp. CC201C]